MSKKAIAAVQPTENKISVIEKDGHYTATVSSADMMERLVWTLAEVVWPAQCGNVEKRNEIYQGYIDSNVDDLTISLHGPGFWSQYGTEVLRRLSTQPNIHVTWS